MTPTLLLWAVASWAAPQEDVETLVRRLGSEKPEEREAATKELVRRGEPVRPALAKAVEGSDAEIKGRARGILQILDRDLLLDRLVARYVEFGLTLPPKDAPLVKLEAGRWSVGADGAYTPHYTLGFLLGPGSLKGFSRVLVGSREHEIDAESRALKEAAPTRALAEGIAPEYGDVTYELNAGLATAIQCKARGWNDLAQDLLDRSLKESCGHRFSVFFQPGGLPPLTSLATLAWAHYGNALLDRDSDWSVIAPRMKAIFAAEAKLDTPYNRALLKSLEAALKPSRAMPGSVEALIDDLIHLHDGTGRGGREEPEPQVLRLAELGFEAVPALIEALDDERLTGSVKQGFNNFPTFTRRVGDIVGDLLQALAGEDLGKDWLRRQQGWTVEKEQARAWWERAKAIGEETYLAERALPKDEKAQWPNESMLRILAKRYPKRLPALYTTILRDRPAMQSWPVAKHVARSGLPREEKVRLLQEAGEHRSLEHRRAAFWELKEIDPALFVTQLARTLDSIPATPREAYWKCPEASFTQLTVQTEDPAAWEALLRATRRADPGLRMEILARLNYGHQGDKALARRKAFLAEFLDDESLRDATKNAEMFQGPYAAGNFPRLQARNMAAMQLAWLLGLKPQCDPKWTDEEWSALRAQVRQALGR